MLAGRRDNADKKAAKYVGGGPDSWVISAKRNGFGENAKSVKESPSKLMTTHKFHQRCVSKTTKSQEYQLQRPCHLVCVKLASKLACPYSRNNQQVHEANPSKYQVCHVYISHTPRGRLNFCSSWKTVPGSVPASRDNIDSDTLESLASRLQIRQFFFLEASS